MSGVTLIIEGGDRWAVPQSNQERATMASYIARVGDVPGRCVDCAFREGSDASKSRLVKHLVEMCLLDEGNNFCCHHGEPDRPCVGFVALRDSLTGARTPLAGTTVPDRAARIHGDFVTELPENAAVFPELDRTSPGVLEGK